jgi:hypothetical protein
MGIRKPVIPVPYPAMWWAVAVYERVHNAVSDDEPVLTPDMQFMKREYSYASAGKARRELDYGTTPARESMEKSYRWLVEHGKL